MVDTYYTTSWYTMYEDDHSTTQYIFQNHFSVHITKLLDILHQSEMLAF